MGVDGGSPGPMAPSPLKRPLPSSRWLSIPDKGVICVEHPGVVRNLQNGIATLGGEDALSNLAASNGNATLHLRFRPSDPMCPPVESRTVPTSNLLVKITIPKRRRRRRRPQAGDGCGNPHASTEKPAGGRSVLDKLRASKGNYQIEVVGTIDKTVRFRDMANHQWNTSRTKFVAKMKDPFLECNYESIQKFHLAEGPDTELIPPPTFSHTTIPHTYNYRQNPAIKKALIDGKTALLNFQAAPKTMTPMVHISSADIPSKPVDVPEYEQLSTLHKDCVDKLRALFEARAIWTRRALYNNFPKHLQTMVRFVMVHVAYMWRAGPWRDTCVRYGIDPRVDPKYRKYQSVFFQIETHRNRPSYSHPSNTDGNSHIFDGQRLIRDGRCYQLCDVTDPLLQPLIETPNLRKTCDPQDGWYRYSTLLKIKAVMKAKISTLVDGKPVADSDYLSILEQESEDEEQEAVRKAKDAEIRGGRAERRRRGVRNIRHSIVSGTDLARRIISAASTAGEGADDEEVEDEEVGGEWEKELELPTSQGQVDSRVQQMMADYMDHSGFGVDLDGDEEGDFEILEADEDGHEDEGEDQE